MAETQRLDVHRRATDPLVKDDKTVGVLDGQLWPKRDDAQGHVRQATQR
jgi:hypothetical protein